MPRALLVAALLASACAARSHRRAPNYEDVARYAATCYVAEPSELLAAVTEVARARDLAVTFLSVPARRLWAENKGWYLSAQIVTDGTCSRIDVSGGLQHVDPHADAYVDGHYEMRAMLYPLIRRRLMAVADGRTYRWQRPPRPLPAR